MCQELILPDGGVVDKVGELKKLIPDFVIHPSYSGQVPEDSWCLCCVDFEETAKAHEDLRFDLDRFEWRLG